MIREEIKNAVTEALKAEFGETSANFSVEIPEKPEHGDYATNAALVFGKMQKKNPVEIAEKLAASLRSGDIFEKVEAASPGFVNFFLSDKYILRKLQENGALKFWKGKKVAVEFTDPNPFKEFHIGHLYSNIFGESLSRLLESAGAEVRRINYQGDIGLHVAKAIWGMQQKLGGAMLADIEKQSLEDRAKFLGESYALGARSFEEDAQAKDEINKLNEKIFALTPEIAELYGKGRAWSLEYFEKIYARLGTKFDFYYFEREVGKTGLDLVREYLKKRVFLESEGAVVFPGEEYGLHRRVFINSRGLPTYEAKELGLAPTKFKDFPYDRSIIVTGSEITDYFKVLLMALGKIYPDLAGKTTHIPHGMVRLAHGKMSSRTGDVVRAEDLLEEVKSRVKKIAESAPDSVAESVAVAAVKYSLLKVGVGKDIVFDIDTSLSLEGASGPYLQYAHARLQSIIQKSGTDSQGFPAGVSLDALEHRLAATILRFPETIEEALQNYSPHIVAGFVHGLAQLANEFYHSHPVLQEADQAKKDLRLFLVGKTMETLKRGLWILGIDTPYPM